MGLIRVVVLRDDQRTELVRVRDSAAKAYLRERAAAILKVAAGTPGAQVARSGLLRPREPDTVYAWLDRFAEGGVAGLIIRDGRGRKPAFSPSVPGSGASEASDPARGAAGPAPLRDRGHPLDPGQDSRVLRVVADGHAGRPLPSARPLRDQLEARASPHP